MNFLCCGAKFKVFAVITCGGVDNDVEDVDGFDWVSVVVVVVEVEVVDSKEC